MLALVLLGAVGWRGSSQPSNELTPGGCVLRLHHLAKRLGREHSPQSPWPIHNGCAVLRRRQLRLGDQLQYVGQHLHRQVAVREFPHLQETAENGLFEFGGCDGGRRGLEHRPPDIVMTYKIIFG